MARTLVTGAAGLLGAACVEQQLAAGREVVALVRDRDPRSRLYAEGLLDRCVEVRAELADAERLIAEYAPSHVLHLAAQTQVTTANRAPLSTFESNVRGTWLLLEACRTASEPPRGVVVASSDKAYGAAPLPYTEATPLAPTAPYDVSKACTDLVARSYGTHFGLPVVVTRCGNLFGPGDLNADRLVVELCAALGAGRAPVFRSSGAMTREWLYVDDAAAAVGLLLDRAGAHAGEAFNVGGGEVASVRALAELAAELAGWSEPLRWAEGDPAGELAHQSLDSAKLRALGWRPEVTLRDGLSRMLRGTA